MKGLAKETRALKNENTLQKKALAENAYKIIGLKTFEGEYFYDLTIAKKDI